MHDAFEHFADRLENRRDRWLDDPTGWVENRLAGTLWSKQREVAELVVRHKRVAVRSCHAAGKTRLVASLACWWIDTHPPGEALVVTTAPSYAQVNGVTWGEIRTLHAQAGLDGKILGNDNWVLADGSLAGIGRRPVDEASWQGYHRPYVLAIIDEAAGVPKWVWNAMETITTSPECRIVAVGNPDDAASEFARVSSDENWKSVKIDAFSTPAFTGEAVPPYLLQGRLVSREWVDDCRKNWGEDSPLWRAKVEAEFADADEGLIPYSWITAANRRWHEWNDARDQHPDSPEGRRVFGVDVAGTGQNADRTAIATRQGNIVLEVESRVGLDTTQVTGWIQAKLRHPASVSVVDVVGIGTGVVDQLRRSGSPVTAYNGAFASRAYDATRNWRFPNRRSESWWSLREMLDPNLDGRLALPPDDNLAAELCAPRYDMRSGGFLVVEPKDETKKRIGRSPDLADAVVMACHIHLNNARRDHHPRDQRRRAIQYANAQFTRDETPKRRFHAVPVYRDGSGWVQP